MVCTLDQPTKTWATCARTLACDFAETPIRRPFVIISDETDHIGPPVSCGVRSVDCGRGETALQSDCNVRSDPVAPSSDFRQLGDECHRQSLACGGLYSSTRSGRSTLSLVQNADYRGTGNTPKFLTEEQTLWPRRTTSV